MILIISVQIERQLVLRTQENYRILKERSVQLKGENKELRRRVERVGQAIGVLIMKILFLVDYRMRRFESEKKGRRRD